jgi:hypothetical protein
VGDSEKASIDNAAAAKSQMHTRTFIVHKSVLSSPFHRMSLIDLDTALLVVEVMAPSSIITNRHDGFTNTEIVKRHRVIKPKKTLEPMSPNTPYCS